jgi:hypothetical protein
VADFNVEVEAVMLNLARLPQIQYTEINSTIWSEYPQGVTYQCRLYKSDDGAWMLELQNDVHRTAAELFDDMTVAVRAMHGFKAIEGRTKYAVALILWPNKDAWWS